MSDKVSIKCDELTVGANTSTTTLQVKSATTTSSTTTGALVVTGGIGVGTRVWTKGGVITDAGSTSSVSYQVRNTGNLGFYFGIESSVGGSTYPGSTSYAGCIYQVNTTPIEFFTNSARRLAIQGTGNVLIGTAVDNAAGGCIQLKSGITFPATQVASSDANTLDDYEEGTFTPVLTRGTTACALTATATGHYTKIGNTVTVAFQVQITAITTQGTGVIYLSVPFSTNYVCAGSLCWNTGFASEVPISYTRASQLVFQAQGITDAEYTGNFAIGYISGSITYTI